MKKPVYKIGSFYLYDNQLRTDYLILYNKKPKIAFDMKDGEVVWEEIEDEYNYDLPFEVSKALEEIHSLRANHEDKDGLQLMEWACKKAGAKLVKAEDALIFIKKKDTHIENYKAYDVWYNEAIGKVNILNYDVAAKWNLYKSQVSTMRLEDFNTRREEAIQMVKLRWPLIEKIKCGFVSAFQFFRNMITNHP